MAWNIGAGGSRMSVWERHLPDEEAGAAGVAALQPVPPARLPSRQSSHGSESVAVHGWRRRFIPGPDHTVVGLGGALMADAQIKWKQGLLLVRMLTVLRWYVTPAATPASVPRLPHPLSLTLLAVSPTIAASAAACERSVASALAHRRGHLF